MLVPLDSALRASGTHFSRYTDDIHLYLDDRGAWPATRDLVIATLGQLGLEANERKTRCVLTQAVARRAAGHDPEVARLFVALRQKEPSVGTQVKAMFDRDSVSADPDGRRIRFALGVFRRFGDDHALRALMDRPVLFSYGAPAWGRYISQMRREGKCDQDWLLEVASVPTTTPSACLQFHALRALGCAGRLSKDAVVRIQELATSRSPGWGPVKVAAADAWARSDGWKAGSAVDAALSAGDISHQRALALSLRHGCENKKRRRAFRKLRTLPGCRPAVAWMDAGCPPVP